MKKILIFIAVITTGMIGYTVNAQEPASFPVELCGEEFSIVVESFEVESVENYEDSHTNRINYVMTKAEDNVESFKLVANCYSSYGEVIATVDFFAEQGYIDVPELTAMIEIETESPSEQSNSLCYNEKINVYSADGRSEEIYHLLLPLYQKVGWYSPVTMYALDGRTVGVSPFLVGEYENVGWYTKENMTYISVQEQYNKNKLSEDYRANIELATMWLPYFTGTIHEASIYAIRTEAMDMWRTKINAPVAYADCSFEMRNQIPCVRVSLTNISHKKIYSFKIEFDVLDEEGKITGKRYDYYYTTRANLEPCETAGYIWENRDMVNPACVSDFKVTEIAFEDGTKWYRNR